MTNKNQKHGISKTLATIYLLLYCVTTLAHDARPVVVTINEQLPGAFQYTVRVPETVEATNQPAVLWPQGCNEQNVVVAVNSRSGSVLCESALQGQSLSLQYPYFNPSLATFYRLTNLEGITMTAMLTPTQVAWEVPVEPTAGNIARQYLGLGMEHILGGLDHLLFVLGLLVIARTFKRILWTVTGFTIAHSITLSLSSLGMVAIPIAPVEAVIALSIVFLAHEISRNDNNSLTYKYPLIVSFGFGLLHGLGFASALGEIGLVQNEIVVSLLFFNLGVEVGQIAFILVVLAGLAVLKKAASKLVVLKEILSLQRLEYAAAYLIGIPAAYWVIDRCMAIVT